MATRKHSSEKWKVESEKAGLALFTLHFSLSTALLDNCTGIAFATYFEDLRPQQKLMMVKPSAD